MRHGSLFSGIGGFDLAAEWMGWENVFHCEWNPFGQKILKHYWPNATSYSDITKTDFSIHRGGIDILTGGFPCQPYSKAGKRRGNKDERHLWPQMLRAIREIQPTWVVGENVRDIINWNEGVVFEEVHTDLENAGYEVFTFILPAAGVNAPHRRDRTWFIAHSAGNGHGNIYCKHRCQEGSIKTAEHRKEWDKIQRERNRTYVEGTIIAGVNPDTNRSERSEGRMRAGVVEPAGRHPCSPNARCDQPTDWSQFPTQSPIRYGDDGLSKRLDPTAVFEGVKRGRKKTVTRWVEESLKGGGNAIVPQVALMILRAIEQM